MMKKFVWAIVGLGGFSGWVSAQEVTNSRLLKQASVVYKISEEANYAKAMSMARQKGWALSYKTRNGNKAVLIGVDDFGFPKYIVSNNNTIAAATTRANQLWPGGATGLNLSGSSANMKNKIGMWDEGLILISHQELTGRVTQKDNPSSAADHSTHVVGTMIASGVNPVAKGMAFGAQGIIAYDFLNRNSEISSEAANLVISNHSYGLTAGWNFNTTQNRWEFNGLPNATEDYNFGFYDTESSNLDEIAFNAPFYLMVHSTGNNRDENGPQVGDPYFRPNTSGQMTTAGARPAGISSNDGYDIIPNFAGAKNVLTVGAVFGLPGGYSRKEDVVISSFSSWGPTDDGRIKPDVVADGVGVTSSVATSNSSYSTFSGTSMAAPNATGSLFLLQEYYSKLKAGAFLRSATLKGLAIHTTNEAGTSPGPDYVYGWGLLNVEKAAAVITAAVPSNNAATSAHLLFENTLTNSQPFTTTVTASGKGPLTATICWTDVKGAVNTTDLLNNRSKKLVNDLDIRITRGSGTSLRTSFPWTLDVNNPSFGAVPGDNNTDNVERIDVDSTVPGISYTITITHKGTLVNNSQAYSLLVSGVGGTAYCASAPTTNTGGRIDSVIFKTIRFANPAGNTTYTNNTHIVADIEPSQVIPITVRVGSSDATNAPKMVKVFIDYNNNGVFDANEQVAATTAAITNGGALSANITTPATLVIGNTYLMRIVLQETSTAADITACSNAGYTKGETQDYRVRVVDPANDITINDVVSPFSNECSNNTQYLTVRIRNNGSLAQTNVPVTATITNGSTTVASLSAVYPGILAPLTTVNYTFQTPFVTAPGVTYTVTVTANLAADQFPANNQFSTAIAIAAKPAPPAGTGGICGTTATLKVTNPDSGNYFWYSTATTNAPFAAGPTVTTTTIPSDRTYYLGKEARASIGPPNKLVYAQGGYNNFRNNFMKFNNSVPLIIESARLYVGNPGTVKITVGTITQTNSDGSFNYQIVSTTTLDVYATNPNPQPAPAEGIPGNPTNDTGAVYLLNLPVIPTGDHILLVECDLGGATLFRNNGITGTTTYPMSLPNIISLTGNSAAGQEAAFYYFFYDLKINTGACVSDRVPVVAAIIPTPVITQVGDSLVSSIASGNQWYLNDTAINGANGKSYKPVKLGMYKVIVTDAFGCQKTSNTINVVVTAIDPTIVAREIKLSVSPNPNNGVFNLSFEVSTKADLTIGIFSSSGQRVYNSTYPGFSGKFSKQIRVNQVSSEFYILKIQHNKKNYVQKLIIQR